MKHDLDNMEYVVDIYYAITSKYSISSRWPFGSISIVTPLYQGSPWKLGDALAYIGQYVNHFPTLTCMVKALKLCKTCTITKCFDNIQLSWKLIT